MILRVRDNLYLGDNRGPLEDDSFQAILAVMNDRPVYPVPQCNYLRVSAPDGPGFESHHVLAGVEFLEIFHGKLNMKTMVHCWSGRSRSISVLSAYLVGRNEGVEQLHMLINDIRNMRDTLRRDDVAGKPAALSVLRAAELYILQRDL